MAKIFINKEGMNDLKSRLYSIANRVSSLENDIARSLNRLDWEVSQKQLIRGQILNARKKTSVLANQSNQMRMFVEKGLNDFSSTDSRIASKQKESLGLLGNIWKSLVNIPSRIYNGLNQKSIELIQSINKINDIFLHRDSSIKITNLDAIKKGLEIAAPVFISGIAPFILSDLLKSRIQLIYPKNSSNQPKKAEKIPVLVQQGPKNPEQEKGAVSQGAGNIGSISYVDRYGNKVTKDWTISNEEFLDSHALTQEQITAICKSKNPGLVDRGFDKAIYEFATNKGINPKVILATLAQEQGWCKNGNYNKAFGVGPGGNPIDFAEGDTGGLAKSVNTYLKWFKVGQELEEKGQLGPMTVNKDAPPYNETRAVFKGKMEEWQRNHQSDVKFMEKGQTVTPANAVMYAKLKYTPWVDFPPQQSHPLENWQDIFRSFK